MSCWPRFDENKPFAIVLIILLVVAIDMMAGFSYLAWKSAWNQGEPSKTERTVVISGYGRVLGVPDIATVSLGVETRGADVASAQDKNSVTMNNLLEKIKSLGIEEKDIQTSSYNVYEDKPWNPETNDYESKGWIVSQQVEVKVRDTSKISSVLDAAGKNGVTNIYGPNFTIDDPSSLKNEARDEAIADAKSKAADLAKSLNVSLVDLVAYDEASSTDPYPIYSSKLEIGYGGGGPAISAGQNEVVLNVFLTYRISQ